MSWSWTTTRDGRVRVLVAGFGFGPRVAAETLLAALGLPWNPWRPVDEFSGPTEVSVVFNFGVREPHRADACARRRVWVDCLMWLRRRLPPAIRAYDLALAEAFFDTRPELCTAGPRVVEVQPLTPTLALSTRDRPRTPGSVLVSFGGIETPYSCDAHRYGLPGLVLGALARAAAERTPRPRLLCCAPAGVAARLRTIASMGGVRWCSPARAEFSAQLESADAYVVQPGLYGPFEAFEAGVPTALTFPMSYTQLCQAVAFEARGLAAGMPLLAELRAAVGPLTHDFEQEQPRCFARIADWYHTALRDTSIQSTLARWAAAVLAGEATGNAAVPLRSAYARACRAYPHVADVPEVRAWLA